MPKTYEKEITIKNWHRGMSDVDLDDYSLDGQASYIQSADLIESKPFLRPGYDPSDDVTGLITNSGVGRVRGYAHKNTGAGSFKLACVDYADATDTGGAERINVFTRTDYDDNWVSQDTDASAGIGTAEPVEGCEFYDDNELYFASKDSNNDITIGQYLDATTIINVSWDTLNTSAWGGTSGRLRRILKHTDGNLYFLKGVGDKGYLGPYDGTSKPSTITPATLPVGYEPVDAISYGNKILVACNSTSGGKSALAIRDPYSALVYTFDDIYYLEIFKINAIRRVAGRIIIITSDFDYKLWEWLGGENVVERKKLKVGSSSIGYIRPQAVDVRDNTLYFGTNALVTGFNGGVYAFGFNPDGSTFLHNAFLDHTDDVSNVSWRAFKFWDDATDTGFVATARDGTTATHRNMKMKIGATRSAALQWDSTWMRPFPNLRSQIIKATLYHEDPAAAGTITFASKSDTTDAASYTTNFVANVNGSYNTVVGNNAVLRGAITGSVTAFTSGRKHKIRITMTNGAQLEKIKLRCRTTEQI